MQSMLFWNESLSFIAHMKNTSLTLSRFFINHLILILATLCACVTVSMATCIVIVN